MKEKTKTVYLHYSNYKISPVYTGFLSNIANNKNDVHETYWGFEKMTASRKWMSANIKIKNA